MYKKYLLFILLVANTYVINFCFADNVVDCFIVKSGNQILKQEGQNCNTRYTPGSTFKITISLMGYDSGILIDDQNPSFNPKNDWIADDMVAPFPFDSWNGDINPTLWIKESVVWYSQVVMTKLGTNKFSDYIKKLKYGNENIFGDFNKNNGLTRSWLSSSLKISPIEQINFIDKLTNNELFFSPKAQENTKKLMYIQDLSNGWKLYGKTGSGFNLDKSGNRISSQPLGYFIGWIEKDNKKIPFAIHTSGNKAIKGFAGGTIAKPLAIIKLSNIIENLELSKK